LESLHKDLAAYSEHDPIEIDKKTEETQRFRAEAETFTDQILSMEGWLREHTGGDKEQMGNLMRTYYGDEFDEEEGCLREL
jgi:hypothetical protein